MNQLFLIHPESNPLPPQTAPTAVNQNKQVCAFFMQGNCKFGKNCKFSHEKPLCKFFTSRYGCAKGSKCPFAHQQPEVAPETKVTITQVVQKISKQIPGNIEKVHSNEHKTFVINNSGTLYECDNRMIEKAGKNSFTQVKGIKEPVVDVISVSDIVIGLTTYALTRSGKCYVFGSNPFGQLGLGHHQDVANPVAIAVRNQQIWQVCAGAGHAVFLTNEHQVFVCGLNEKGQLGISSSVHVVQTPTPLLFWIQNSEEKVVKIQAGIDHTLYLTDKSTVYSCGLNSKGQCGLDKAAMMIDVPSLVSFGDHTITDIAAAGNHSLFLTLNGTVLACGANNFGQCAQGDSIKRDIYVPTVIPSAFFNGAPIKSIFCCPFTSSFVTIRNELYVSGDNETALAGEPRIVRKPVLVKLKDVAKEWEIASVTGGYKQALVLFKNDQFQASMLNTQQASKLCDLLVLRSS